MDRPTSVYIIACGDCVKIGISNNPEKRLETLITGMSDLPRIVATREFASRKDALDVETDMHRWFGRSRTRGEWFRISVRQAMAKLRTARPFRKGEGGPRIAEMFNKQRENPTLV